MKANIGPYLNWIGPYQIADMVFFWVEKYPDDESLYERWDYKLNDRFGKWLASTWVNDFCEWVHSKKKRKVKIHIDNYDIWSMDHTLALIVHPMLIKLQERKHGAPNVSDLDVPEELRSSAAPPKENDYDTDENWFKRWDWVMNEMIWAFEQIKDDDWESQYCSQKPELDLDDYPEDKGKSVVPLRWKVEGKYDWEGMKKHQARIDNGLRLFGVYFQGLWD